MKKILPAVFSKRTRNNSPVNVIIVMTCVHLVQLFLVKIGVMSLERLVAVADVFFLLNAIVGLLAAMVIFLIKYG